MKHIILSGLTVLMVQGCTEFSTYYKEGTTKSETNIAQGQCNVIAAEANPPRIVTDWIPVYNRDGRIVGHRYEQYDLNEGRRYSAARNCMTDRGFARVKIPYCKDEQIAGRNYAPISAAPALGPNICGLKTESGDRVLIDLSKPI